MMVTSVHEVKYEIYEAHNSVGQPKKTLRSTRKGQYSTSRIDLPSWWCIVNGYNIIQQSTEPAVLNVNINGHATSRDNILIHRDRHGPGNRRY